MLNQEKKQIKVGRKALWNFYLALPHLILWHIDGIEDGNGIEDSVGPSLLFRRKESRSHSQRTVLVLSVDYLQNGCKVLVFVSPKS